MILAFPRNPTVRCGEELELCVSTDAPAFRVELYRWGAELTHQGTSGWLDGRLAPPHLPQHDWGRDNVGLAERELPAWPRHRIAIGASWPPGVYVAVLVEGRGGDSEERLRPAPEPDARSGRALFVVRGAPRPAGAAILYNLPLLTWHAYNQVSAEHYTPATGDGGWCAYSDYRDVPFSPPLTVSVLRPGGGTGASPYDTFNPDPLDPTPRQTFVHWDAPAVAWLERNGYRVDFCTDLDLHAAGDRLLSAYRLLLMFGHDEYWSAAMRAAVERFVATGGNVAFFGGNTCWWRIAFEAPHAFRRDRHWSDRPAPDVPENPLTGVSFRNGGERPGEKAASPPVGFRVQHADHWVYGGTGLREGDVFGGRPDERLVGYECDGAHFDRTRRNGAPVRPTGEDGTPADFTILGVGDTGASGWGLGNRAATLGLHSPGGTVFTAATTDWARLLAHGSPVVERITRNVLDGLG